MPHGDHATVKWFAEIGHKHVGSLEARMDVKFSKKEKGAPRCSLEVMAKGNGLDTGEELAYCHATLCPATKICRIKWLGRTDCRPVHQSVRGKRSVLRAAGPEAKTQLAGALPGSLPGAPEKEKEEEEEEEVAPVPPPKLTVAEALLGVAMSILTNFGADTVELQAMDNGSRKLVRFYAGLGLRELPQIPGEILWMEGPVKSVVEALPTYWLDDLLPADFDGPAWLQQVGEYETLSDQLRGRRWFDECRSHTDIRKLCALDDLSDPASPASGKMAPASSKSTLSWSKGKRFLTTLRRPGGVYPQKSSLGSGSQGEG